MEHVDRLTARERYYVEGNYYGNNNATYAKSIDAYKKRWNSTPTMRQPAITSG